MKAAISVGMSNTTIHAPCTNFVTAMVSMTMPVTNAPTPLRPARQVHPSPRTRNQRRTMAACDSVKEMNTPTA